MASGLLLCIGLFCKTRDWDMIGLGKLELLSFLLCLVF